MELSARRISQLAVCLLLLQAAGCDGGGPKYAPTSGVITLDGKPYPDAVISFQPHGTAGNPNPGRGSSAYTDETGRFVLQTDDGNEGAAVGKHLVRIMTKGTDVVPNYDPDVGSPDQAAAPPKKRFDPIPPEWSTNSTKEFEVPPGGTDQANFDIVTRK